MNTLIPHSEPFTSDRDRSVAPPSSPSTSRAAAPAVEIVIPVHNEQLALDHAVRTLHAHLIQTFAFSFRITIADNASTDATLGVASALVQELDGVEVLYLDRKGRGHALRCAWSRSDATVLAYMDVDLSTDLAALDELLTPLLEGRGDLAIGSRLAPGAEVTRGLRREVISRGYNLLLRALLGVTFSDAQCGFKAGRREVVQALLDDVQDNDWFFDTELLYLAQQRKLAIHEVPVRWVEDLDSRVEIVATAREDLRGVIRLRAGARASREHALEHAPESSHGRLARLHPGRLRSRSTGLPT